MERGIDALVVAPSSVARDVVARMLSVRCHSVGTVGSVAEAWERIGEAGAPHLLIVDLEAPEGGPWSFLRRLDVGENDVVPLLAKSDPALAASLLEAGALEVLVKPVADRHLGQVLRRVRRGEFPEASPRVRGRIAATAHVLDEAGEPVVAWEVHDLSRSGALLLSHAPFPVGMRLGLRLAFGHVTARAVVEIVRIQEPAWGVVPGVAVRFVEGSDQVAEIVHAMGGR